MADNMAHPDEATWERLAVGELDAAARDAAFDHILECERCSRIWRGVLTLKSEAEAQGLIPLDTPARCAMSANVTSANPFSATSRKAAL